MREAHATEFHDAVFQEAVFQEAVFQEAEFHDAEFQEAEFQEASAAAVLFQLAASKTGVDPPAGPATRNAFKPAFGFGGVTRSTALSARTSPTPVDRAGVRQRQLAVDMSAPLT